VNNKPFIRLINIQEDSLGPGLVGVGTSRIKLKVLGLDIQPLNLVLGEVKKRQYIDKGDGILMLTLSDYNDVFREKDNDKSPGSSVQNIYKNDIDIQEIREGEDKNTNDNDDKDKKVISGNLGGFDKTINEKNSLYSDCIRKKKKPQREKFCEINFKSEKQRKKCKANFCDFCCVNKVFFKYTNLIHQCKKSCYKSAEGDTSEDSKEIYNNICLNTPNPEKDIYSYCENRFPEVFLKKICKYDMCNLCCININIIESKLNSYEVTKNCFLECSKKFKSKW